MQTVSSAKSYYRYKINSDGDLSVETLARRLVKMKFNYTTDVLLDWTAFVDKQDVGKIENVSTFYRDDYQIAHLFSFHQISKDVYLFFESGNAFQVDPLHVLIQNAAQMLQLDEILIQSNYDGAVSIHFLPLTKKDLMSLARIDLKLSFKVYDQYSWQFLSYDKKVKQSLTTLDIGRFFKDFPNDELTKTFKNGSIKNLEIWNDQIPPHYELEPEDTDMWHLETSHKNIRVSVIIPSFNNCKFLANTVRHLINQDFDKEQFEIIVVEDGGTDRSFENLRLLFEPYKNKINLKMLYWSKSHPTRGPQQFFRAGLARNLGVRFSSGDRLVFLDSDILVPQHFISTCELELRSKDVIQFQRYHIHQQLSHRNPAYHEVCLKVQTYVEEKHYWDPFFECSQWDQMISYWKYTCTYALGLKKSDFIRAGRFKKYYVSYGFEDTDLGYELHRRKKSFKLVKMPLLHLTSYDQMQYKNSSSKRTQLLKKTAAQFYLQHLDPEIFTVLGNYFRFEKPLINTIKDFL